jgi:cytoskeletal protein CcmA (bactofilin family)
MLRQRTTTKVVLVGAVVAGALAVTVGGPVSAVVLGHPLIGAGQQTSLVQPKADDPGGAGNGPMARPNVQGGSGSDPAHGKSHKTACPSGGVPAAGTTINGGLVVDGNCTITGVTVNGGVLIKGTGHLSLYKSTVNGGVDAEPRGEFDSNSFPTIPGGANTLNGGVSAKRPVDMDLTGGIIRGGVHFFGQSPPAPGFIDRFTVCGVHIQGDVTAEHLLMSRNGANIGDPGAEATDFTALCDGNTISGSVRIKNNPGSRIELEGNTIGGSVEIFNSEPSVSGNTIGGSLQCHEHAKLHVWDSDDTNVNTIRGANRCA